MKTFTRMAAQGDFLIMRIDTIPENAEPIGPNEHNQIVVAHSESGHSHIMLADRVSAYKPAGVKEVDLYEMFLSVEAPTEINHLRSFDTHEALLVPPGNYTVRRQREYIPDGFRKASD
jgi:hypothetical protein